MQNELQRRARQTLRLALKIHARGYDAYLVGAQPLLEGGPAPIYRFPGGDSLVDECEMLPAEEASDE